MVNLIVHSSAGAVMARFNISKDSAYFPAGKRKGDKPGAVSRLHTTQASNMTTIPLIFPTRPELFHRPLGLWNPLVSKKLHVKNQNKLQSGCCPFLFKRYRNQARASIISEQKRGLLVCLSVCCDELDVCTVLPAMNPVYCDVHSLQCQALLLLMLPFVVAYVQRPCLSAALACCH